MFRTAAIAVATALAAAFSVGGLQPITGHAATGSLVGGVNFSVQCSSGIGVGVTFDGSNLWYSCYAGSPDLLRADPKTGVVSAAYNITTGLGAIAYDGSRNAIWAAPGGTFGAIWLINLDAGKNVTSSAVKFNAGSDASSLDDGLGFDAVDDTLYFKPDNSNPIHHYKTDGTKLGDITGASSCFGPATSGLAIGGSLLFEGKDGCSHVFVVDKVTLAPAFDFSTAVAGDPNFRDEGLSCDTKTFAPVEVMWSKEAYSPMRAHAFEIPTGTCGVGGQPADKTPPSCDLTGVIDGPPKQIQVTVQDPDGGLKSVDVTDSTNATVSVPPFTAGTTDPVVVTATKVDQSSPSSVGLQVTDVAGNVTMCDPALLSVGNVAGERHQVITLASGEGKVTIHNGKNGIRTFKVRVNGQTFAVNGLTDGQVATLDIRSALTNAENKATISGSGPSGSEATVVFST